MYYIYFAKSMNKNKQRCSLGNINIKIFPNYKIKIKNKIN